uniref:Uncharacterized protein n=1 Tax=Clydonella sawyeri TaxID=2201168 RepID=A0A2U9DQR0_9EUKA|nr:hypothetical protein [Clydonella sawyeri]
MEQSNLFLSKTLDNSPLTIRFFKDGIYNCTSFSTLYQYYLKPIEHNIKFYPFIIFSDEVVGESFIEYYRILDGCFNPPYEKVHPNFINFYKDYTPLKQCLYRNLSEGQFSFHGKMIYYCKEACDDFCSTMTFSQARTPSYQFVVIL